MPLHCNQGVFVLMSYVHISIMRLYIHIRTYVRLCMHAHYTYFIMHMYVYCMYICTYIYQIVILGNASVTKGMAIVTINDLQCGVTYNITAEGMLNETLVGPGSSHGSVTSGPCPLPSSEYACNYTAQLYCIIIL